MTGASFRWRAGRSAMRGAGAATKGPAGSGNHRWGDRHLRKDGKARTRNPVGQLLLAHSPQLSLQSAGIRPWRTLARGARSPRRYCQAPVQCRSTATGPPGTWRSATPNWSGAGERRVAPGLRERTPMARTTAVLLALAVVPAAAAAQRLAPPPANTPRGCHHSGARVLEGVRRGAGGRVRRRPGDRRRADALHRPRWVAGLPRNESHPGAASQRRAGEHLYRRGRPDGARCRGRGARARAAVAARRRPRRRDVHDRRHCAAGCCAEVSLASAEDRPGAAILLRAMAPPPRRAFLATAAGAVAAAAPD